MQITQLKIGVVGEIFEFIRKRSDLTSVLPEAVAAIQAQKLVKSPEELNGYIYPL
ncbi:MAG: hypothetical protein BroJett015_24970 [Chloroflexota bacterium]|nr:MAG: hypothetical protein BroJett015_24970 [Chloroflexota bacterium]